MIRLCDVLSFFSKDPALKDSYALKGGTAINLLFTNLPRLSVDIDLDMCENLSRENMEIKREETKKLLIKYMEFEGYKLSEKTKLYHSLSSYVFDYINSGGVKDNIKIEINNSLRTHVLPTEKILIPSNIIRNNICVNSLSIYRNICNKNGRTFDTWCN